MPGDVEAAYRRYYPLIREKCRRVLGEGEADDVAQETFIRLWRAGLADLDARSISSWIYKTSTRMAIDRLREDARRPRGDEALARIPDCAAPSDEALAARRRLAALAGILPESELEVALLSRVDRLTQDEIAEVLGVSSRTVRRSLRRLEERLGELRDGGLP